jgi:hypothetical protein
MEQGAGKIEAIARGCESCLASMMYLTDTQSANQEQRTDSEGEGKEHQVLLRGTIELFEGGSC